MTMYIPRLLFAALIVFLGCATAPDINVLLITLDTTRADRLGCYGYAGARTPALDRLASEGVLFENCYTPAPVTLPAHASLFTGLYPPVHGVRDNGIFRLEDEAVTLAELLREAGMNTAAVVASYVLASRFGLAQGFGHYDERLKGDPGHEAAFYVERPAGEVTDAALEWLEGRSGRRPFFLWTHFFDPHSPYRPPAPFDSICVGRPYDGEIAYMDSQLGRLLDQFKESGEFGRTLIVVCGDHGESLGEHGEPTHGIFVYNPTVRVPLVIKLPDGAHGGTRVAASTSLVDILPTVLEAAGLERPVGLPGRSLLGLADGSPDTERPLYLETLMPEQTFGWHRLEGMVLRDTKYIEAPQPELYDLAADPAESRNLVLEDSAGFSRAAGRFAYLKRELESGGKSLAGRMELDSEAAERLRALGYVSGGAPRAASGDSLPDPKLMIGSLGRFMDGVMAEAEGEYAAALEAFDSVLALDPENLYALRYKGYVLMETGRVPEAIAQFEQAVELQPDGPANYMLALAWNALDSLGQTRSWLERTVESQPGHARAHAMLAGILLESGQTEAASYHMHQAHRLAPQDKEILNDLGLLLLQGGENRGAAEIFEQAVQVDPDYPLARYNLGITRYRLGQLQAAAEALAPVAEAYSGDEKVQNNLGVVLADLGRLDEAKQAYRAALAADSSFAPAWNNLANLMAADGKRDEAEHAYLAAVAADSAYAQAWFNLGRFYQHEGLGAEKALPAIRRALELEPDAAWAAQARELTAELEGR